MVDASEGARAGGAGVHVSVQCEAPAVPGRLRCDLDARVDAGAKAIRWGDVQILETPAFIAPLKGRVAPSDATERDASAWRFSFALVARSLGAGDVVMRARFVLCDADGKCAPREVPLRARVTVGP